MTLEQINQAIYREMKELGLLKEEKTRANVTNEDGSIKRDRYGNPIVKTITRKNYRVANVHKKSKAKTYYVEEPTYRKYKEIKKKNNS